MSDDQALRAQLRRILDWEDAHASLGRAAAGLPARLRGVTPDGWAHSAWQLLEHLRICQHDILDFCRNPKYVEMAMEELKAVYSSQLSLEDCGTRGADWPTVTNITVRPGYNGMQARVEPNISEQSTTQFGSYVDWNSTATLWM